MATFDSNRFRPDPKKFSQKKIPTKLKRVAIKKKFKPTGEKILFEAIWNSRKHVSFIDENFLGNEAKTFFFAHVLPKGKYPNFRLLDRNIVLLTQEQHHQFDFMPRSEIINHPQWQKLFELEEKLKSEYKLI